MPMPKPRTTMALPRSQKDVVASIRTKGSVAMIITEANDFADNVPAYRLEVAGNPLHPQLVQQVQSAAHSQDVLERQRDELEPPRNGLRLVPSPTQETA